MRPYALPEQPLCLMLIDRHRLVLAVRAMEPAVCEVLVLLLAGLAICTTLSVEGSCLTQPAYGN